MKSNVLASLMKPGAYGVGVLCLCAVTLFPACRKRDDGFQVVTIEGTIDKITLTSEETGEITVRYTDKSMREVRGTALVTQETEIMIGGAVAKLKDVREGERVRGEVRVERTRRRTTRTALKIYVDRAQPVIPDS